MSEGCVATLYSCMKNLEEEIKTVLQMCERTKDSQIRDKSHLKSLSESLEFMSNKFDEQEHNKNITKRIIMETDIVNMNERIEKLERTVDRQGQYSHRNCLLPYGIAEGGRKNIDDLVLETLNEKMHVDLAYSPYWLEERF